MVFYSCLPGLSPRTDCNSMVSTFQFSQKPFSFCPIEVKTKTRMGHGTSRGKCRSDINQPNISNLSQLKLNCSDCHFQIKRLMFSQVSQKQKLNNKIFVELTLTPPPVTSPVWDDGLAVAGIN